MKYTLIIFAVVFVSGTIGGTLAYILSLRNEIRHLRDRIKIRDYDYLNLNDMCSMMSQHYAKMMDDHEKALEELEEEKDNLRKELEEAQEEIIKYQEDFHVQYNINDDGNVQFGVSWNEPLKYAEANSLREATKDLDFPPVDKIEDNDTSDAISKFLNRQAKKEE